MVHDSLNKNQNAKTFSDGHSGVRVPMKRTKVPENLRKTLTALVNEKNRRAKSAYISQTSTITTSKEDLKGIEIVRTKESAFVIKPRLGHPKREMLHQDESSLMLNAENTKSVKYTLNAENERNEVLNSREYHMLYKFLYIIRNPEKLEIQKIPGTNDFKCTEQKPVRGCQVKPVVSQWTIQDRRSPRLSGVQRSMKSMNSSSTVNSRDSKLGKYGFVMSKSPVPSNLSKSIEASSLKKSGYSKDNLWASGRTGYQPLTPSPSEYGESQKDLRSTNSVESNWDAELAKRSPQPPYILRDWSGLKKKNEDNRSKTVTPNSDRSLHGNSTGYVRNPSPAAESNWDDTSAKSQQKSMNSVDSHWKFHNHDDNKESSTVIHKPKPISSTQSNWTVATTSTTNEDFKRFKPISPAISNQSNWTEDLQQSKQNAVYTRPTINWSSTYSNDLEQSTDSSCNNNASPNPDLIMGLGDKLKPPSQLRVTIQTPSDDELHIKPSYISELDVDNPNNDDDADADDDGISLNAKINFTIYQNEDGQLVAVNDADATTDDDEDENNGAQSKKSLPNMLNIETNIDDGRKQSSTSVRMPLSTANELEMKRSKEQLLAKGYREDTDNVFVKRSVKHYNNNANSSDSTGNSNNNNIAVASDQQEPEALPEPVKTTDMANKKIVFKKKHVKNLKLTKTTINEEQGDSDHAKRQLIQKSCSITSTVSYTQQQQQMVNGCIEQHCKKQIIECVKMLQENVVCTTTKRD